MKIIFRNFVSVLKRYKVSNIINILGLSLAFASLFIILSQVYWNFTYNHGIKDYKKIYQIEIYRGDFGLNSYIPLISIPYFDELLSTSTSIETGGLLTPDNAFFNQDIPFKYKKENNDIFFISHGYFQEVDTGILDLLSYEPIIGDLQELEKNVKSVAISESYSKKYQLYPGDFIYLQLDDEATNDFESNNVNSKDYNTNEINPNSNSKDFNTNEVNPNPNPNYSNSNYSSQNSNYSSQNSNYSNTNSNYSNTNYSNSNEVNSNPNSIDFIPTYTEFKIVAIYKDFPENCFNNKNGFIYISETNRKENYDKDNSSYCGFIKLYSKDDVKKVEDELLDIILDNNRIEIEKLLDDEEITNEQAENFLSSSSNVKVRLTPLNKTFFSRVEFFNIGEQGSKEVTLILLSIAILIIVMALVNFINFFFALVPKRIKSINTYKVYGSKTSILRFSLMFESFGIVVISLLVSILIVNFINAFSPINILFNKFELYDKVILVLIIILIAIVFSLLSSIYPSYYITSFEPSFIIKGNFGSTQKGRLLRKILIGFQFVVSIGLLSSSLLVKNQYKFIQNFDYGFKTDNIYSLDLKSIINQINNFDKKDFQRSFKILENKLKENPIIVDLTIGSSNFVEPAGLHRGTFLNDKELIYSANFVSHNFLKFMGIEVFEGRDFNINDTKGDKNLLIFNREAKDTYNLNLDQKIDDLNILGFCENFNFKPLQYKISPYAFYVRKENASYIPFFHFYIKTISNANAKEVVNHINRCVDEVFPDVEKTNVITFKEEIENNYKKEKDIIVLINAFTIVAIVISIMGVFGLVLFESEYRRKEICLRRVNGATIKDILIMFNKKYIIMVLICSVIAIPISYYFVSKWLQNFAFKIKISSFIFIISILIILVITIITVTISSYKVATENPATTLNRE